VRLTLSQLDEIYLLDRFLEPMVQVSAFLMEAKEGDGHFAAGANYTLQAFANFS
jgi:hypothetical protein